jgi:diaminopimelate decarboxylase
MDYFEYREQKLYAEEVPVAEMVGKFGTPLYIYSKRTCLEHFQRIEEAFAEAQPLICYSVKANSNLAILKIMAAAGAGFDVVSGGELYRALKAGAEPKKIVFAGVGKTQEEIKYALEEDILILNVESPSELEVINRTAGEMGKAFEVALRINPGVSPQTHDYVKTAETGSKFGMEMSVAEELVRQRDKYPNLHLSGLHMHIGSQITSTSPFAEALERLVEFAHTCRSLGMDLRWLDIGGGFGIYYKEKEARTAQELAEVILPWVEKAVRQGAGTGSRRAGAKLILEPGRFIVGNAGILVTKVLYRKESGASHPEDAQHPRGGKRFLIVDAGMNDLIRPSLYGAYHRIWPIEPEDEEKLETADIVGPVCESGDFFAKDREIPRVEEGEYLSIFSAGAYGMAMSSQYNSRPRSAEVLVDGSDFRLIRKRETYEDLIRGES